MPLKAPDLDTRSFEEIFEELRLRIPRYAPEWTDFNESDPGITMLQLFSSLSEMMLYQMNRIPERNYIKFLQLLNMELRPAQSALAHLTFMPQVGASIQSIRARSQVSAQPPDGGDPLVFETEEGLDLIEVLLTDIQVFDGQSFVNVSEANQEGGATFRPLGWTPQVGSALYLGFTPAAPPTATRPFPEVMRFRVFLDAAAQAGLPQSCTEVAQPPGPPVGLVWEHKPTAGSRRWQQLNLIQDDTVAFTREGYLRIQGPSQIEPTKEGKLTAEDDKRYWIRCRLESGSYPTNQVPEIDFIRPNVVPARNLSTIRQEVIDQSEGHPNQTFQLRRTPVVPDSLDLRITDAAGESERWEQVDDFLASGPDDPHYTLNATKGEIRFGDGRLHGRIPVAGADIVAFEYRYGGGQAGNVGPNLITTPMTPLTGVEAVTNERPAEGGRDEQEIEDLKTEAPEVLRHRNRAVSAKDFAALAKQAGGVAKATGLALAHPDHPGVEVPGAVTVIIVPDSGDIPPEPSSDLIRHVCGYLDEFRLLTTELFVRGPEFKKITVDVRVAAEPYAAFGAVSQDVEHALDKFLNPIKWEFGRDLFPTNLYEKILEVPDVRAVLRLQVLVNDQPHSENLDTRVVLEPGNLVYGADHEIVVTPYEER
jgi:predicted phage baseplate assembly protein